MTRLFRAEWMKYRRTATPWLILAGPLLCGAGNLLNWVIIQGLDDEFYAENPDLQNQLAFDWDYLLSTVGNAWPGVLVPFGAALLAVLAHRYDLRADGYRGVLMRPVLPQGVYLAKLTVIILQALGATVIVFMLNALLAMLLLDGDAVNIARLAALGGLVWLTSWPLLALHLWLTIWRGVVLSLGVAVVGFLLTPLLLGRGLWMVSPWAYPVMATAPSLDLTRHVISWEQTDVAWSVAASWGAVGLSLGVFVGLAWGGAWWFARHEIA